MDANTERRARVVAQIANYAREKRLKRHQAEAAARMAVSLLDVGKSGASAYEAGRKAVDAIASYQSDNTGVLVA